MLWPPDASEAGRPAGARRRVDGVCCAALLGQLVAGLALAGFAVPVVAQDLVSPGYSFLKAVRDRDGDKVQKELDKPGTTVILSRDDSNGETALHIVTKRRDIVWMRYMLAKGVSINGRDRQGNTALLMPRRSASWRASSSCSISAPRSILPTVAAKRR